MLYVTILPWLHHAYTDAYTLNILNYSDIHALWKYGSIKNI